MGWQTQDLTSQVDGVATTFTTTFHRNPSTTVLFHDGSQVDPSQFSEPDTQTIETAFTPLVGEKLYVVYVTDQTVDGRVSGHVEDPTGAVEGTESILEILEGIEDRVQAAEARLDDVEDDVEGIVLPAAEAAAVKDVYYYTAPSPPVSEITLPHEPYDPEDTEVSFEGVGRTYGEAEDFHVVGSVLHWHGPSLDAGDKLKITLFYVPTP